MVGVGQVLVPVKIVSERLYRSARVYVIVGLVAKLQGTLIPTISYSLRRWKIESVHKVMSDFSRQAVSFLGFVQTPF